MFDDYAQKLLSEQPSGARAMRRDGRIIGYEVPSYDYHLLKLFFISLIWRASVSLDPFFRNINLGSHESTAKAMLKENDPGGADAFGVVISYFDHPLGSALFDPHPEKFTSGIRYNRFYLGRYIAYIKTDGRPAVGPFSRVQISPSQPLRIVARDLERSAELPLMYKIASAANHSLEGRRP